MTWAPSVEQRIRHLAGAGKTAEDISRALSPEFQLSRNAVIGFCRRKKIALTGTGGRKRGSRNHRPSMPGPVAAPQKPAYDPLPATGAISLADAGPDACRWIIGEPRQQNICGHNTASGRSYCPTHARICYQ